MAASEHSEPHKTPETPTPSKGEKTHDLDKNTSDNAGPPPVALPASEEALLSQLRDRRQTVEQREAELDRKRQMITQAERKLIERADQLSKLETQLEHLEAMRREHDESNWKGLVKTYETMKPRDAASIMNDLDLPTTLQVLDRMKDAKAGMVLAAMTPDRARLVTTELAQMRSKSVTIPEAK